MEFKSNSLCDFLSSTFESSKYFCCCSHLITVPAVLSGSSVGGTLAQPSPASAPSECSGGWGSSKWHPYSCSVDWACANAVLRQRAAVRFASPASTAAVGGWQQTRCSPSWRLSASASSATYRRCRRPRREKDLLEGLYEYRII